MPAATSVVATRSMSAAANASVACRPNGSPAQPTIVTPHVLRHSFASIANDLGFTEVTIAALVGHSKGTVTSKYIHTLDTALIMAADTISGYVQGLLDGIEFKQTTYALDRSSRKAALSRFLQNAIGEEDEAEERLLAA